jgi:hypothetical protein
MMCQASLVRLFHGRAGTLQQRATDRDGITQHSSITGRPNPFGAIGLDREPDRTDPSLVHCLERLELAGIDDGEAAPDG